MSIPPKTDGRQTRPDCWTAAEDEFLREHYPARGAEWVAPRLPGTRTAQACCTRAGRLGLVGPGRAKRGAPVQGGGDGDGDGEDDDRPGARTSRPWDPAEDALVRHRYASKGPAWIAERIERTSKAVMNRASKLGVCRPGLEGEVDAALSGVSAGPDPDPEATEAEKAAKAALEARRAEEVERERKYRRGVERRKRGARNIRFRADPEAGEVPWSLPEEVSAARINGQTMSRGERP
jgi:hypothetical protein